MSTLQGKLTSQGKLLQQETFFVTEQDAGVLSRSKERRVFLFEQIVIFSELLRKGSSTPGYQFKKSIKVRSLYSLQFSESESCAVIKINHPWFVPRRCPTWVWRTVWTTTPASLCCPAAARRSASPCRPPTSTSSRSGSDIFRKSWMHRATSCLVSKMNCKVPGTSTKNYCM